MSENTNNLQYSDSKFHIGKAVLDKVEGAIDSSTGEKTITLDSNLKLLGSLDISGATQEVLNNPEWIQVTTDSEGKILEGITTEGKKKVMVETEIQGVNHSVVDNPKMIAVQTDAKDRVIKETYIDGSTNHYAKQVYMDWVHFKKGLILPDGSTIDSLYDNSIERLYSKHDYTAIFNNITRPPVISDEHGNRLADYQRPLFLHFSDIHRSVDNAKRIMEFYNLYHRYIADVILSGDIAEGNFTDYNNNFENIDGYKDNVLRVIGNHDVYDPSQTGKIRPADEVYNKFFKGIENWGVTYAANKCYYYKDYPDANLRLIVIDIMRLISPWNWGYALDDQEQLDWLTDTLESARQAGYSVIISAHWAPADPETTEVFDTSFMDRDIEEWALENHESQQLLSIVDTFIENGGDFVCWLCGHRHADVCGTTTATGSNHKQLFIEVECAISRDHWSNYFRGEGTKAYDCFNLFSVDTYTKVISMYRIGAEFNSYMQHKVSLSIDYKNKILIK